MNTTQKKETIYESTDYDQFHFIVGNRPIKPKHVARLAKRMREEGFLPDRAIDVNPDGGVAEGQHRLLAAKEAGVPYFYRIMQTPITIAGIQGRNVMMPWTTHDFLNSYIARGDKRYIQLKAFADEYRLSVAISYWILTNGTQERNKGVLEYIREDKFEIVDYPRAERLASLVSEVRRYTPDAAFSDRDCVRALSILLEKTNPKELFNQLKQYQQVITRRRSVKDYLLEFENILNQGRTGKPIELT